MWKLSERGLFIRQKEQEKVNERLKAQKRDPITDYELDLRLFGGLPFGHPCKAEFLIRCWNHESETADVLEAATDFARLRVLGQNTSLRSLRQDRLEIPPVRHLSLPIDHLG
jgi:hypothetical protein